MAGVMSKILAASKSLIPVTITALEQDEITAASAASHTLAMDTGNAAIARKLVAIVATPSPALAATALTINGNAATLITSGDNGGEGVAVFYLDVAEGAFGGSQNLVGTTGVNGTGMRIYLWAVFDAKAGAPFDSDYHDGTAGATTQLTALTIPAKGGAVVGNVARSVARTFTWTEVTEDFDTNTTFSSNAATGGAGSVVNSGAEYTPTLQSTASGVTSARNYAIIGASFEPA